MTEETQATEAPKSPARRKVKRAKPRRRQEATTAEPKAAKNEFAGVSANRCCDACTPDHCVISTVDLCKHPYKTGDSGCGPITMANRAKVKKLIKHQLIEAKG